MQTQEILERIERTLKNWDGVMRRHERDWRRFWREEKERDVE